MILFTNPGELDLRLVSTFGINVKPNSTNPVGYFGTGLKYALAVLAREGCEVIMHIGETSWRVAKLQDNVRGKNVEFLQLEEQAPEHKSTILPLPFTTDLGRNWKLWMAYRELYYNCMDEQGWVDYVDGTGPYELAPIGISVGETQIVVSGLDEIHAQRETFLLLTKPLYSTPELEIHPGAGTAIFYRGIKVCDLDKPTVLRYNFLRSMDLTEDRTLALPYMVPHYLKYWIAGNLHDRDLLERILTAHKGTFEHDSLDYGRDVGPSREFLEVAEMHLGDVRGNSSARQLVKSLAEPTVRSLTGLNPVRQAMLDSCLEFCRKLSILVDRYEITHCTMPSGESSAILLWDADFINAKTLVKALISRYLSVRFSDGPERETYLLSRLIDAGEELTGEIL